MTTSKIINQTPELRTKTIGFDTHDVDYVVKGIRTSNVLITKNSSQLITRKSLDELSSKKTIKIRFAGVPRARIGEIIRSLKKDRQCFVYVKKGKPIRNTRTIPYFDVLIKQEEK